MARSHSPARGGRSWCGRCTTCPRTRSARPTASGRRAHRLLMRNIDGILALTDGGLTAARAAYPELAATPGAVTRHGHYRDAYDFSVSRAEATRSPRPACRRQGRRLGRPDPRLQERPASRAHLPGDRRGCRAHGLGQRAQAARGADPRIRPARTRASGSICGSFRTTSCRRCSRPPTSSCCPIGAFRTPAPRSSPSRRTDPCWSPTSGRCGSCRPTWAVSGSVCTMVSSPPRTCSRLWTGRVLRSARTHWMCPRTTGTRSPRARWRRSRSFAKSHEREIRAPYCGPRRQLNA